MISSPTAAILLIGDELLSGRTRDINLQQIATYLAPLGIPVRECRTVPDVQAEIVAAVNALRSRYTYVFTTGGIGPTHDDITADAIAAAFSISIDKHPGVMADLAARYEKMDTPFTEARQRMARIPEGAALIENAVSGAPGFQVENVFVMAGVPQICRAMLEEIGPRLETSAPLARTSLRGKGLREGDIADALGKLAEAHPTLSVGSYPWFRSREDHGVELVASGTDVAAIKRIADAFEALFAERGIEADTEA